MAIALELCRCRRQLTAAHAGAEGGRHWRLGLCRLGRRRGWLWRRGRAPEGSKHARPATRVRHEALQVIFCQGLEGIQVANLVLSQDLYTVVQTR